MRRIGLLSKKVDMERLKKMTAAGKKQEVEVRDEINSIQNR